MSAAGGVGPGPGPGSGPDGGSAAVWRRHIGRQLRHRDLKQRDSYQDLIRLYSRLLEKASLTSGILSSVRSQPRDTSSSTSSLMLQKNQLKKKTGELAFEVVELQQQEKKRQLQLETQSLRLEEAESRLAAARRERRFLRGRAEEVREENRSLKERYDALLERQKGEESRLRAEKIREARLLDAMIHPKQQAAARVNIRNERRSRVREAHLQRELQAAARSKVAIDSSLSAPTSRSSSPRNPPPERSRPRLVRSSSVTLPRILTSFRGMFEKRRGRSFCSLEEDQLCPVRVCGSARVPARALQVLEAHEEGINAVRFSCNSALLATGGTDRVIKLWEVRAGMMTHRTTLDGSTEGITCVDFDPTGLRIIAASYDKSAILWRMDDSVPKLTLTGHRRKVTSARFSSLHQVVTGSADGTVRLWDLQRAACVQKVEVGSFCSDLVCSENCIVSGHFDGLIRVWDTRAAGCIQEIPAPGKVTSLDISSDHRQLLSCCRDDSLQLVDLRTQNLQSFRADGFSCGSDSTKAVLSPDGLFLAGGSADGAVYIWKVSSGSLETRLPDRHRSSIGAVSWSLSGEYVVSVDKSRRAVLWSDM